MKKALLIGINYTSVPGNTLYGCIYDTINMRNMLIDAYDFDVSNITMLRDDMNNASTMPTKSNIINNLNALAQQSANLDEIWIHYSGHGSQIKDTNGDEASKNDQLIVPVDYVKSGYIIDDDLLTIIKNMKCRTILLFDSCNSGTVCDLPWSFQYISPNKYNRTKNNSVVITNPNIFMFSGCKDNQTSADTYSRDNQSPEGAFTNAFIRCLRANHHNISYLSLYQSVCIYLSKNRYTQLPIFSSSNSIPSLTFTRALTLYKSANTQSVKNIIYENMKSIIYNK